MSSTSSSTMKKGILKKLKSSSSSNQMMSSQTLLCNSSQMRNSQIRKKSAHFNEENIQLTLKNTEDIKSGCIQIKIEQKSEKIDPIILKRRLETLQECKEHEEKFKNMRREHVNEFRMAKEILQSVDDEDMDNSLNDNNNNNNNNKSTNINNNLNTEKTI